MKHQNEQSEKKKPFSIQSNHIGSMEIIIEIKGKLYTNCFIIGIESWIVKLLLAMVASNVAATLNECGSKLSLRLINSRIDGAHIFIAFDVSITFELFANERFHYIGFCHMCVCVCASCFDYYYSAICVVHFILILFNLPLLC